MRRLADGRLSRNIVVAVVLLLAALAALHAGQIFRP